jgi:protein O-GlcNAc transferase
LQLPDDYQHREAQLQLCTHRLGLGYLEDLRHSRATYCSEQSKSQLTCFHSQADMGGRIDSFCIGQGARLDATGISFQTSCHLLDEPWGIETNESSVPLALFPKYWYETGPHNLIDKFVNLAAEDLELPSHKESEKFTVLLKREGAVNPWHSLMEIMSLAMTFDVLRTSPNTSRGNKRAFITSDDADNTQVVVLDDEVDGPYFDLWRLFAKKPTIRLSELPASTDVDNIIIPLPGASNPVWQGDWEPNSCENSELLRVFSKRVLRHLNISDSRKSSGNENKDNKIIVTFIDRRGTRKLLDQDKHIAALNNRYAHAEIRLVDLAIMTLAEQIQTVRDSDVLAGVHGSGLTHGMWLKEHSVLVEILPEGFLHKGFRNLAGAMGLGYFSTHGHLPPGVESQSQSGDDSTQGEQESEGPQQWQIGDVALEDDRFLKLMDVAIKSIYNRGPYNFDVIK